MKIKRVEFAGAIGQVGQAPPGVLPQIAFSGRSNVGKSSLINRLLGRTRTHVARVSARPGKTQEINFYEVDASLDDGRPVRFYLVDLPGYGYAKVPQSLREKWRPLIEGYLRGSRELLGVVQLIDARHGPTADDLRMVDYLAQTQIPALFVLTKVDKLRARERESNIPSIAARLGVDPGDVVPFSSLSGEGREDLLASLESLLVESRVAEARG